MRSKYHDKANCPQDEDCRGCFRCYLRTGETVCDGCCEHAADERAADEPLDPDYWEGDDGDSFA